MKKTSPVKQSPAEKFTENGPVTRAMVHLRARELAVIDGRAEPQVSQNDYEQAKREMTGESELVRQEAILDGTLSPRHANVVPAVAAKKEVPS